MIRYKIVCLFLYIGLHYATAGTFPSEEANALPRLHMVPATRAEADMRCNLEGGVVTSPTTNDMAQVMSSIEVQRPQTCSEYTGSNSIQTSETFTSIKGFTSIRVPLSAIPLSWAVSKSPSTESDEKCVAVTGAGKHVDVSCDSVLPYFCRKENAYICRSKEGYKWEPLTGSCYKFHQNSTTWFKALRTCHAEGGHLTIINSNTEASVVKEISNKYPNSVIIDAINSDFAFVGFRLWDDGEWGTIYGDSLAAAGYARWKPGEPNNSQQAGVDENCGCVGRNVLLNDCPCTKPYPFICEITP